MASSRRFLVAAALLAIAAIVHTARASTVLDVLQWGLEYIGGESEPSTSRDSGRQCSCDGPSCICCMGFNFTYIDFGGPGCVKLNYLSQEEGLTVNVSYGDNLLHSEQVKGPEPKPTCLDLFTDLVQMCAHITEFSTQGEGLRGCVALEPTILGDPQTQYLMGCFLMGPSGMALDRDNPLPSNLTEAASEVEEESEEGTTEESETVRPDANEEALIAVVNETAEQSISWLSSLLGLSFGSGAASKPAATATSSEDTTPSTTTVSQANQQQQRSMNDIR